MVVRCFNGYANKKRIRKVFYCFFAITSRMPDTLLGENAVLNAINIKKKKFENYFVENLPKNKKKYEACEIFLPFWIKNLQAELISRCINFQIKKCQKLLL